MSDSLEATRAVWDAEADTFDDEFTGSGLPARRTLELVREHREEATLRLLPEPVYWGKDIDDERYVVVSTH